MNINEYILNIYTYTWCKSQTIYMHNIGCAYIKIWGLFQVIYVEYISKNYNINIFTKKN
jgi:hypothetical protein